MSEAKQAANRERDVATLRVLGIFFSVMGALVLVASYKAIGNTPALVVNVISALILVVVGGGMLWASRRLARGTNHE